MVIEKANATKIDKLYRAIERNLTFLRRRGIAYIITPHNEDVATIQVSISGRRGTGTVNLCLYKNFESDWILTYNGYKYYLTNITDIGAVCRRAIIKLQTTLNRF